LRGRELLAANAIALTVGLALYFAFRPPHALPLAGLFLAGCLVVQWFQSRQPVPGQRVRNPLLRGFALLLNGLYGSFFALLAYYVILAVSGQIGYPYR
jgi:hypothetical protein